MTKKSEVRSSPLLKMRELSSALYRKISNIGDINEYLGSITWDEHFAKKTVEEMIALFYDISYATFDIFVPVKRNARRRFPKRFSQNLKAIIIQKS